MVDSGFLHMNGSPLILRLLEGSIQRGSWWYRCTSIWHICVGSKTSKSGDAMTFGRGSMDLKGLAQLGSFAVHSIVCTLWSLAASRQFSSARSTIFSKLSIGLKRRHLASLQPFTTTCTVHTIVFVQHASQVAIPRNASPLRHHRWSSCALHTI